MSFNKIREERNWYRAVMNENDGKSWKIKTNCQINVNSIKHVQKK